MGIVIESENRGPKTEVSHECEGAQKQVFWASNLKEINE